MKTERRIFLLMSAFMLPLGAAYAVAGHWLTGVEIAGTILLVVVAISFGFIGVYLWLQERKDVDDSQDQVDGDSEIESAEVGVFPTASIWPFVGALGLTVVGFGLVYSFVLAIPGIALIGATIIGMAREGYSPE